MNPRRRTTIREAMARFAIAIFLGTTLLPVSLQAQGFYGSVVGTVTDATGAVVPDATVIVTNVGTNGTQTVHADRAGKFSFVNLVPAVYKVNVEKTGFKRFLIDQLTVAVGAESHVDALLQVGATTETVEVSTQVPLLQPDSSSLNQEIEGSQVQEMPLNGRNVMNLLSLAPGVIANGSASGGIALDQGGSRTGGGLAWGNFQIGGAIPGQSAQFIDGAVNNLLGSNIIALVPTQDAVQEFSVISNNATADFGRYGGGVVNMTTKSGGNAFHGSAYEYIRNTAFNANDWFSNQNGLARSHWNQNQFGAALSGPIKRDKAFFLSTWEGFQATISAQNATNVPTAAMQGGVFTTAISDPRGNCTIVPNAAAGTWTITNLYGPSAPGGLDSTCGDPLNRILKTFYPAPNSNATAGNYFLKGPLGNTQNQYNERVDYNISSKQRLFARYTYWNVKDTKFAPTNDQGFGGTTWPTSNVTQTIFAHQAVLGDTYTLTPTTVLSVNVDYTRVTNPDAPESVSVDQTQFDKYNPNKYYTALAPQMSVHTLPTYLLSGSDNLYQMSNFGNYSVNWYNNYHLSANLLKTLGSHSIKVGGEFRLSDSSGTGFVGGGAGFYTYTNDFTGDEFASFLMGYPTQAQFQTYARVAGYDYYQGYYVTDTWQARRNLTLNLGLRYELPGGIAERNNKMAVLLPNAKDPYTGITGTEALVASPLYRPRTFQQEKYNLFAPRVGLAYRVTNDTVLGGGYGLSYLPNDLSGVFGLGIMPYYSVLNSNITQRNIPVTGAPTPLQTLLGGIVASGITPPPQRSNPGFMTQYGSLTTYLGQNLSAPDPNQPYAYTQQWNVSLSHQFKGDMMAEVSYAGLRGTNLTGLGGVPGNFSVDELASQYYPLGPGVLSATIGDPTATAAGYATCPNAPGLTGQISVGQCLRPNPYYNNMFSSNKNAGWQNYNSIQTRAEKRFKSAGVIMASYVWAKNMSNADTELGNLEEGSGPTVTTPQDFNNLAGEYSLLGFDVKSRAVVSYLLNLPFGKGQRFGNSLSGAANTAISGWAIDGITTFQSGFPIFLVAANPNDLTNSFGAGQLRPNVASGCNKMAGTGQDRVAAGPWFNTACFSYPSSAGDPTGAVSFGNEPRVDPVLRSDGIKNFDLSLQKSTRIFESASFVFRAEFFNLTNRVQFAPPVNAFGAGGFGYSAYQVNKPRQIQFSGRINF